MKIKIPNAVPLIAMAILAMAAAPAFAQSAQVNGKLKVHISPSRPTCLSTVRRFAMASQTIALSAGSHTVDIKQLRLHRANEIRRRHRKPDDRRGCHPAGLRRQSQRAVRRHRTKGPPARRCAAERNHSPEYFVGHVDEFDNNLIWHQWLLVKPGNYRLTATEKGQTVWSGPVTVKAGERVIVDLNHNGATKTKDFKRGLNLGPEPRFEAGIASAMVPVAPVSAQLAAQANQITCGGSAQLNWKTGDAVDTSISNIGNVAASGEQSVSPTHPTTYQLTAKGPGGTVKQNVTVNVNAQPTATLALSQPQVRYHKIGDKVVQQDSATLNWSASNAGHVTIQPLGSVSDSGSRSVEAAPDRTEPAQSTAK